MRSPASGSPPHRRSSPRSGWTCPSFPTPAHLASWARFAPGVSESAGRKKGNAGTGHGNRYLARALGEAAAWGVAGQRTSPTSWPRSVRTITGSLRRAANPGGGANSPRNRIAPCRTRYLAAGGSAKRAAAELYVHQNTVTYRIKRAEELLGRSVTEDPVELICALTLAATLGAAVLGEHGSA